MVTNYFYKNRLYLALIIGIFLFIVNVKKTIHCGQLSGCVDTYWATFWLISYSDGYDRRALLGQIVEYLFGNSINHVSLNILAFSASLGILFLVYLKYFSFHLRKSDLIPFLIILSGPTSTVFFEVLGDPLHFSFLLVLIYSFIASRVSNKVNVLFASLTAFTSILIHEASIFIILPAICVIYCITSRRQINYFVVSFLTIIFGIAFALIFNTQTPTGSGISLILKDSSVIHASTEALPSFTALLKDEITSYFGSLTNIVNLTFKILGVSVWPLLVIIVLLKFYKDMSLVKTFIPLLLLSSPLYAIAHDWGRFVIYTLLLSMYLSAVAQSMKYRVNTVKIVYPIKLIRYLRTRLRIGSALFLFPLLFFAHPGYRINGLVLQNTIYVLASLALIFVFHDRNNQSKL